jgi:hypothetical protein
MDLNGLNWQLSIQIDFVPRLQTLQGITRSQRRDGEQLFKESQMRLQKQTKIKKKRIPKRKYKILYILLWDGWVDSVTQLWVVHKD